MIEFSVPLSTPGWDVVRIALRPRQPFFAVVNSVEIHDLAGSPAPEHCEALLRLRAALDAWIADTGDRGAIPEPPEVVAPFAREMHDWFSTPSWHGE
ncbi:MAG TPA: hypothetical protein P5555_19365 [Candidatus Paceibacterota bacterium]|nr:hypothetical protein [Verrucomicrobiota bacterium]HOX04425.1 hypothetical protein [Verrucomicrobiota bacterium]HRZ47345.1 hypothetical protein [Candidatus Paceibacterota bacterium]